MNTNGHRDIHEFNLSTYIFPPWNQGMAAAIPCHTQLTPLCHHHQWLAWLLRQMRGSGWRQAGRQAAVPR